MPERPACSAPFAIQYSAQGKASRNELPPQALVALFDVLDALAMDPDAYPGRTNCIGRDGSIRIYKHPNPAIQVTFEVDLERRVLHLWHFVAPKVNVTKPVFISYSHKDAAWLQKFKKFLKPLEERELIHVWDDTEIRPGQDWLMEINKALESARVAVFLVTQNYLSSPFIRSHELPLLVDAARDRGCVIFWIAVSTASLDGTVFERIQAANSPENPLDQLPVREQKKIFSEMSRKMKAAVAVE